jgi:dipeptidyl-peptidase-4
VQLGLIPADGGDTIWVQWDRERYPYLATVKWEEPNTPLTILVQNRRQTEEMLLSVDPGSGNTSTLLVERDSAWLELDQSMPHWLPDGSAFLWITERNGTRQLELRGRDGRLIAPLTTTAFRLKRFVAVDAERRCAYVTGGEDLTQTHVFKLPLDGAPGAPIRLTTELGLHSATFSKNGQSAVYSTSTLDGRRWQVVRRANGTEVGRLRSVAEVSPITPNIELTTVGHDPKFHAMLVRPRNFDAQGRYPVIVSVYGGPGGLMVTASASRYVLSQWIADHGFIVVSLDGRGTPSRGRAWERAIKHNVIDLPLSDHIAGLKALGGKYPELDLSRVGIYGWSFGGYFTAMAVMRHPDVFHVGVAGAPVSDWLDYDTHYTERFMGLPEENPEGYRAASVLTYAKDLKRPLLIVHGTTDDNVYFMHSLKMSEALFRAGKEHDFLPLSGFTHMVPEPLTTVRLYQRIVGYFEKHLTGVPAASMQKPDNTATR